MATTTSDYPFTNLVFEGGGVKGFAYLGALQVLDERGVLPRVERVAGASAGAITAMVTSFKLDLAGITALVNSLDFSKIPQRKSSTDPGWWNELPRPVREVLERAFGDLDCLHRLVHDFGWYSSEYFYGWLQEVVKAQTGNPLATFADFRARGFLDLHVVGTDISTHGATLFSYDATPNVAVADAVRMSMSIPLYFESLRFDGEKVGAGDRYNDGGTVLNYPIDIFDHPRYAGATPMTTSGRNPATLGLHLYTPSTCPARRKPVKDLVTFIENLFETLLEAQDIGLQNSPEDLARTVKISNCCVAATDFGIKRGDATYEALVTAGITATRQYLAGYPGGAAVPAAAPVEVPLPPA